MMLALKVIAVIVALLLLLCFLLVMSTIIALGLLHNEDPERAKRLIEDYLTHKDT